MPAYYLYAGFITLAILVLHWGQTYPGRVAGWNIGTYLLSIWFYFVNYAPGVAIWERAGWVVHLWSLAVEEQFYLIWPPLLAYALRARVAERLGWILVAAIATNRMFYDDWYKLEHRLDSRGLGIMLGCAVAISLRRRATESVLLALDSTRLRLAVIGAVAILYAACTMALRRDLVSELNICRYSEPAFDVLFVALIASFYYRREDIITWVLSIRPVVYIGKISYGIYLYHIICQYLIWEVLLAGIQTWPSIPKYLVRFSAFVGLTLGMAALSYHCLERPLLAFKDRLRG
jgi:peptidoglycan/LPS O-acetylase OafA/YrhL